MGGAIPSGRSVQPKVLDPNEFDNLADVARTLNDFERHSSSSISTTPTDYIARSNSSRRQSSEANAQSAPLHPRCSGATASAD
jgi:hypothetical protein